MFPTLDISNLVRKTVFAAGWSLINPVTIVVAFSSAVAGLITLLCSKFDLFVLPSLSNEIDVSFANSNDFWSLVSYTLAFDTFVDLIDSVISFVNLFIPFSISFLVSFVGACFVFRTSATVRKAWMSLVTK